MNGTINATEVLVIGATGEKLGILPISQAIDKARAQGLDLVEVRPHSVPPVCKILDYGKFKYQIQKKAAEARKKQKTIDVKEVKIRPNIDTHDYEVKLRNVLRFLEQGDKVKITVRFRGREMAHPELGAQLLCRLCEQLVGLAKIEAEPRMEGRQLTMVLIPANYSGGKPIDLAFFETVNAQAAPAAEKTDEAPAVANNGASPDDTPAAATDMAAKPQTPPAKTPPAKTPPAKMSPLQAASAAARPEPASDNQ